MTANKSRWWIMVDLGTGKDTTQSYILLLFNLKYSDLKLYYLLGNEEWVKKYSTSGINHNNIIYSARFVFNVNSFIAS